jgi:hypothetical protein
VDRAYHEEIAGLLHGLLIRLGDRLSNKDVTLIAEFIDANELGLALEQIADVQSEDDQPLTADEGADMLGLAAACGWMTGLPGRSRSVPNPECRTTFIGMTEIRLVMSTSDAAPCRAL